MATFADLIPGNLRPAFTTPDGTGLKANITTGAYSGTGAPTAANQVKPCIVFPDGTVKASWAVMNTSNTLKGMVAATKWPFS